MYEVWAIDKQTLEGLGDLIDLETLGSRNLAQFLEQGAMNEAKKHLA